MSALALFLICAIAGAGPQQPSTSTGAEGASQRPAQAPTQPVDSDQLPVSLDKIQRQLARAPLIKLDVPSRPQSTDLPLFRVEIEGQRLTIEEILGPDFLRGPVPYGGMTHQEFLNMVTPTDVQGYAAFSNKEAATVAVTAFALQWALKTAIREFQEAKDERAREAARKEVQEALEALRKARRDAGLPDK